MLIFHFIKWHLGPWVGFLSSFNWGPLAVLRLVPTHDVWMLSSVSTICFLWEHFIPVKDRVHLPAREGDSRFPCLVPTLVLTHCWASGCLVSQHPGFPIYEWSLLPDLINVCKLFLGSRVNIDFKSSVTALWGKQPSLSSLFQEGFSLCIFIFIFSNVILNLDGRFYIIWADYHLVTISACRKWCLVNGFVFFFNNCKWRLLCFCSRRWNYKLSTCHFLGLSKVLGEPG